MIAKLELWTGMALAVLAGIAVAIFYGYQKGNAHAADKVQAARAKAASAKAARDAYAAASDAMQGVEHKADQKLPPDTDARDDLDNTF